MHIRLRSLATAAVLLSAVSADAASDPRGVWIDHTGRGAVEITDCDDALCGRLVWLKDSGGGEACGIQIIGDVQPAGSGIWDKGWIYDPEQDARYSVELKPISEDRLRVLGYLGTKLFSETMVWQRAPGDLERCSTDETAARIPADPGAAPEAAAPEPAPGSAPNGGPATDTATAPEQASPPESASGQEESNPERRKSAENAPRRQECKIAVPYFTMTFPCPDR